MVPTLHWVLKPERADTAPAQTPQRPAPRPRPPAPSQAKPIETIGNLCVALSRCLNMRQVFFESKRPLASVFTGFIATILGVFLRPAAVQHWRIASSSRQQQLGHGSSAPLPPGGWGWRPGCWAARHRTRATSLSPAGPGGVAVGIASPRASALRTVATGLMPDMSAQPVRPVAIRTVAATLAALMTAIRKVACHTGKAGAPPPGFRRPADSASVRLATRGKVQEGQEVWEVMVSHQLMGLGVFWRSGWQGQRCR